MKQTDDLASLAARALANDERGEPSPVDAETIQRVAAAIRARKRRRRAWWVGGAAVAAAVVATLGVSRIRMPPTGTLAVSPTVPSAVSTSSPAAVVDSVVGGAEVLRADTRRSLAGGSPVGAGDELVAPAGARLAFSFRTGTRIAVDDGGDLTVLEDGPTEALRLSAGSMRADVHKLLAGERFLVKTRDAEIEVRGTSFRVTVVRADPACGGGTTTRLVVYEGVVQVRAASTENRVGAGETWPAGCSSTVPAASVPIPPTPPTAAPSRGCDPENDVCVANAAACSNGGTCSGGACPVCGAAGQACCPNDKCGGGGCCVQGSCLGEGDDATPTTVCSNGRVVACGAAGDPCCSGSACTGGCCDANACVAPGTACHGHKTCQANGSCQ